ncbi:MAG TPA: cupredoxin domain-containing protein [Methylomirabilota bacterium]|jgi:plastocyanin domain-containing protein|nr:cupredoxin domain-containing protein [Methylomirabilota bacterium]
MRLASPLLVAVAVAATLLVNAVSPVAAQDKPQEIPVSIENNRFNPEEIKVKAGKPFVLVVTNKDAKPEEFESKELRIEKVIPGGKTANIRVRALKPGTYPFFGEYNPKTAQGRIVAE